jgi:hypothetical protein
MPRTAFVARLNKFVNLPIREQILESIYVHSEKRTIKQSRLERPLQTPDFLRVRTLKVHNVIDGEYIYPITMSDILSIIDGCKGNVERIDVGFDRTDDSPNQGANMAEYPDTPLVLPQLQSLWINELTGPGSDSQNYPERRQTIDILKYLKAPNLKRLDIVSGMGQQAVQERTLLDFLVRSGCQLEMMYVNDHYLSPKNIQWAMSTVGNSPFNWY